MLRIYQAHFSEEIKNTEAQRKFHHSYKEKACTVKVSRGRNAKINLCWSLGWLDTPKGVMVVIFRSQKFSTIARFSKSFFISKLTLARSLNLACSRPKVP